ncbi:hypothetical protein ATDW_36380 (plasmid) [Asticcacaulis sp. DW145]|uniref:hypothetical protein n=1 Tax=Asticcacaulis sp. DW145 TaxID=3095608 RepID=UPI0030910C39|nr:hypothetical protein ATDW_36380 [Asticcacaulis sp. DW145]
MPWSKLVRTAFAVLVSVSGISDQAYAEPRPKPTARATAETFVFVPSDAVLKQSGQTRAQYNAAHPEAERRWREAWAAKGTKTDTGLFASIRSQCAAPKDASGGTN